MREKPELSVTDAIIDLLTSRGGTFNAERGNALAALAQELGRPYNRVSNRLRMLMDQGVVSKEGVHGRIYKLTLKRVPSKDAPARPLLRVARERGPSSVRDEIPTFPVVARKLTPEDIKRLRLRPTRKEAT